MEKKFLRKRSKTVQMSNIYMWDLWI